MSQAQANIVMAMAKTTAMPAIFSSLTILLDKSGASADEAAGVAELEGVLAAVEV